MLDVKNLLAKILYRSCGGAFFVGNIAANSYKDISVTFDKAFDALPSVVVCLNSNSTSPNMGYVTAAVLSRSTTGFVVRVFNADTSTRTPWVDWVATVSWGGYLTSKLYEIFSHLERWWEHVRFKGVVGEDIKRPIQSCREVRLLSTCKLQRDDTSRWFNAIYQITRRSLCGFLYSRCKNDANTDGVGCNKDSGEQSCIGIYKSILFYIKRWWHIQILLWKQSRGLAQCYRYLERKYRLSSWRCSTNVRYGRYNIATISERRCVAC